jgi:para-aminobenzoate synthetase
MQLPASNEDDFWNWFGRGHTPLKRMNLTQGRRWKARQPSVYHASAEEEDRKPRWKGGWVGWWGYEMKAESLGGYVRPPKGASQDDDRVDACWAWCNQLVQREQNGTWTARGILDVESAPASASTLNLPPSEMLSWLNQLGVPFGSTRQQWKSWTETCQNVLSQPAAGTVTAEFAKMPRFVSDMSAEEYMEGIQKCRKAIFAGDSYELTMTTPFRASVDEETRSRTSSQALSRAPEAIKLYLQLRRQNPAPYSTYLSFPTVDSTILSSSPERFLRITPGGRIEMKPIKGTRARVRYPRDLKLAAEALGEGMTDTEARRWCEEQDRQIGESLRNDGKERAENLMVNSTSFTLDCI